MSLPLVTHLPPVLVGFLFYSSPSREQQTLSPASFLPPRPTGRPLLNSELPNSGTCPPFLPNPFLPLDAGTAGLAGARPLERQRNSPSRGAAP